MDNKINVVKEKMVDKLELPREIVMNVPKITITGDNEITIENHKGIVSFDNDKITINTKLGLLVIRGSKFEILFIGGSTITVGGKFKAIDYQGDV